ncbi:MAG TPA: hypothetical protein VF763_06255 [Candidatus Limnocylindrales bacterium]
MRRPSIEPPRREPVPAPLSASSRAVVAPPRPAPEASLRAAAPDIAAALLRWWAAAGRRLAVRERRDPWFVLVLEVMSQQTQLGRAAEAAERFVGAFPTPTALASASGGDVLREWSGLGYNRRAIALQAAARAIAARHGGEVPAEVAALDALPGVGPYTARAVAAQAFGLPVGPVDVNVRRVLSRLLGEDRGAAALQRLADGLVDGGDPAAWTHATMDLAVLVCRRDRPACDACPVAAWCAARGPLGRAARRRPARAATVPERFVASPRWLRGALVRELAGAPAGVWVRVDGGRGGHDAAAVRRALESLAREGLLELAADGSVRLPAA